MRKFVVLSVFFVVFLQPIQAQHQIGMNVNATKIDFFHGITYSYSYKKVNFLAGFEYGMVRSLFQSRFFPRLTGGVQYAPVSLTKFQLGPTIQYAYSTYCYNKPNRFFVQYHQLSGGLFWSYGSKWKIGQTLLVGGLWQRQLNNFTNSKETVNTFDYVLQIDLKYAF